MESENNKYFMNKIIFYCFVNDINKNYKIEYLKMILFLKYLRKDCLINV